MIIQQDTANPTKDHLATRHLVKKFIEFEFSAYEVIVSDCYTGNGIESGDLTFDNESHIHIYYPASWQNSSLVQSNVWLPADQ